MSHTRRNKTLIPVGEFWNLAGRAGRALAETEGHVLLIADDYNEARALGGRYLDRRRIEPVKSVLFSIFSEVAQARFPSSGLWAVTSDTDLGEHPLAQGVSSWDALDGQLLAMAAEEIVGTEDEDAVTAMIGSTLWGIQLAMAGAPIRRSAGTSRGGSVHSRSGSQIASSVAASIAPASAFRAVRRYSAKLTVC